MFNIMTSPFARCLSRNVFTFQRSFTTRNNQHRLLYNTVRSNFLKQQIIYKPKYVVRLFSAYKDDSNKKFNIAPQEVKLGLFKRFKIMYRDYWYVLVPVHLVTTIGWFGGFYYMAKSGVDIVAIMQSLGFSETIITPFKDSNMGYWAISIALFKIATPFRYTVTFGGTTISINYLKEWGYIKPVLSRAEIKEIYRERRDNIKESLKDRRDHLKEKYQETRRGLRYRKKLSRERQDNIKSDYATFKQELKYLKTKIVTKVPAASKPR